MFLFIKYVLKIVIKAIIALVKLMTNKLLLISYWLNCFPSLSKSSVIVGNVIFDE